MDFHRSGNGIYAVSADQKESNVDLTLNLSAENGMRLEKAEVATKSENTGDAEKSPHTVRLWAVVVGLPIAGGGIHPVVFFRLYPSEEKIRIAKLQKR